MPLQGTVSTRYYFDEAASGTSPTTVEDYGGTNLDLASDFDTGTMSYSEPSANHRCLESTDAAGDHVSRFDIDGGDRYDDLGTITGITIEIVVDVDVGNSNNGRIAVINDTFGSNPEIGLTANASSFLAWWKGTQIRSWSLAGSTGKHLWTLVYDTTEAIAADRLKIYKDGSDFTSSTSADNNIASSDTLGLDYNYDEFFIFNRDAGYTYLQRSIDGRIFYVAVYATVLTTSQISNNDTVLDASDDQPAAGGDIAILRRRMEGY